MAQPPAASSHWHKSPTLASRDPTLTASHPATSKNKQLERIEIEQEQVIPFRKRLCTYLYNKEENTCCGRTCLSWFHIISYSIVYICFLSSFTCCFLYASLWIVRWTTDFQATASLLTYSEYGVGISATPTALSNQPLIWYRKDQAEDYQKYINALDNLLVKKRRKRDVNRLGPCGEPPYGYGDKPCVILRINKQLHWSGKPLEANSTEAKVAPFEVQNWLKKDKKLWLHCGGYHPYDKEHIGRIRYFPDPPGFDPDLFPLGTGKVSPLIAIQITDFEPSVSLTIECKLWYVNGPSSVSFVLYVTNGRTALSRSNA